MTAAPKLTDADWRAIEWEWTKRQLIYGLTEPQRRLVVSEARYPGFVGGFGSGKTHGLVVRTVVQKLRHWQLNQAYYLPTYDLVRQIAFPRFTELLAAWSIDHKLNRNDAEITFPDGSGRIIFRTMDRPERIVGYEVADSCADELDTLPRDQAAEVWNRIIARNRAKKPDNAPNTAAVGTTPEGFRFVYDRWQRNPADGYELIQAPTQSNANNLPGGYIETLQAIRRKWSRPSASATLAIRSRFTLTSPARRGARSMRAHRTSACWSRPASAFTRRALIRRSRTAC